MIEGAIVERWYSGRRIVGIIACALGITIIWLADGGSVSLSNIPFHCVESTVALSIVIGICLEPNRLLSPGARAAVLPRRSTA